MKKPELESKYGCPLITEEEITVVSAALSKYSNYVIGGQGARNLAYHALVELRGAHFDEARANGQITPGGEK